MDMMIEVFIVYGEEEIVKDKARGVRIGKEDGKSDLLGDRVVMGSQRFSDGGDGLELLTSKRV